MIRSILCSVLFLAVMTFGAGSTHADESSQSAKPAVIDATSLRGKVLCGYQGWFRCPGDRAEMGWIHWSRNSRQLTPKTLTFEMWPDISEFGPTERFPAPGFTDAQGKTMELFSSDHEATIRRHFEWMRTYGIDGIWLQHFAVDLPGGPSENRYASRSRVLNDVRKAASESGRAWALTFDIAGMPNDKIVSAVTREWRHLVDSGVTADERYIHEGGKPVVQVWGFYHQNPGNHMTAEVANQLIDFFAQPGPYHAYLIGGGDWNWRRNSDPEWRKYQRRFNAYSPWNVGNYGRDAKGEAHASTGFWPDDRKECEANGVFWLPVVYPGFSWDNLQRKEPGTSQIPRRGGKFLWEQFHALSKMGVDSVCVAMFDEVDEGTAIFKVTNSPPTEAHFATYEGLPSNWYLRLVGEATRLLRSKQPIPAEIPIHP